MIPVTRPFSPPIEEYIELIQGIWERNWYTNNGPLVNKLESQLKKNFDCENLLFLSNGTIALQFAIKALSLDKEIITTPFSYVATTSSIVWEGCVPVFVDIKDDSFNIDPDLIESKITSKTQAILATHCFGNPCEIEKIEFIAKKYNLFVIYDAAHCFGTKYKGESIAKFGDISTMSFHSTKLFHSVEGGAVFSNSKKYIDKISYYRNFGHDGFEKYNGVGINGKNSEFHAAMGLCNLKYTDQVLARRKEQYLYYVDLLKNVPIKMQKISINTDYNYSYFPILFESEKSLKKVMASLEKHEIFSRRYFYPSLSSLNYVQNSNTPISDDISRRIVCLPLFHLITKEEQALIVNLIKDNLI
jgi:dTDP-4-amino-4,6-dideoxygalactose transaminase